LLVSSALRLRVISGALLDNIDSNRSRCVGEAILW